MLLVTYATTSPTHGSLVSLAAVFVSSCNAPPQQTAAHIRTTLLAPFEPITAIYGSIFRNCFAPNYPFICLPIIPCILSDHVLCQVVSQKAVLIV